jgi:hypothetical protein
MDLYKRLIQTEKVTPEITGLKSSLVNFKCMK